MPFEWLRYPVLNGFTRMAVEASPVSGELRVMGFEPTRQWLTSVVPATAVLDVVVDHDSWEHGRPAQLHGEACHPE